MNDDIIEGFIVTYFVDIGVGLSADVDMLFPDEYVPDGRRVDVDELEQSDGQGLIIRLCYHC